MNGSSYNIFNSSNYFGWSETQGVLEVIQILLPEIVLAVFSMIVLLVPSTVEKIKRPL